MSDKEKCSEIKISDEDIREFGVQIGFICNLELGGKFSKEEAYERIKSLWKTLKKKKKCSHEEK